MKRKTVTAFGISSRAENGFGLRIADQLAKLNNL